MRIVLSCCVLLPLAFSVWCQTNSILIGETSHPIIYNRTVDIAAANRPWYKSMISYFTRSEKPVQNVNYTFEPLNNSRCLITGVQVMDADRFGKGGLAKIIGGGLNTNNVTINFISKPGEAMRFNVTLNGYCVKNQPIAWHANNVQHANPINYQEPVKIAPPKYGWVPSSNGSLNDSSVLIQNLAQSSNSSGWWHFW